MQGDAAVGAVTRMGGVARTSVLLAARVPAHALTAAVRSGQLLRPRQGVYALPQTPAGVLESLSHCGVLACVSAARDYGIWTLDDGVDEAVHTWISPDHRPTRIAIDPDTGAIGCCETHRDRAIDAPDIRRVGVLQCLRQILACRGAEPFFAALESAMRQRLITATGIARLRAELPQRYRWLVDFARWDSDSGLESILRLRLHRVGLVLASQVRIPGVGDVDFVVEDCLILEADGATHEGESRHKDRIRDAVAMVLGFVTLRFDSALILHDWELVESAVLAAISRDLHRSHAGRTW